MVFGSCKNYYWIQWDGAFLSALLRRVPDIVLGRYLINTSFDSGILALSDEERRQGWRSAGALTCSPRISDILEIPHCQYDEWLVFSAPTEIQSWKPFVNYSGMSLADPQYDTLQDGLWKQMESIRPESYLAEGDRLIFITRIQHLYDLAAAQGELNTTAP